MSIEATLSTWKLSKNSITSTEKLFLLACANRAGESHECWPSLKRLENDTGLDRKTIIKVRQSIIDKKLMEYTGSFAGRSNQIPIMRLTYVDDSVSEFTSTKNGTGYGDKNLTGPKNGTGTSTKNGTGYQSQIWDTESKRENLKEEPKTYTYISDEMPDFDDEENGFDDYLTQDNSSPVLRAENSHLSKTLYLSTAGDPPSHFDENDKSVIIKTIALKKETLSQKNDHSVSSDEHNIYSSKKSSTGERGGERFDDFWKIYPVKQAKHPSRKKWIREGLDKIADEIIFKIEQQVLNDRKWLAGYIPNPLTYINQRRWEDEIDLNKPKTHLSGKQQSSNSFHETMAKYSNKLKKGYYDESGNFTECYL